MKRMVLSIIVFVSCLKVCGQQINHRNNYYRESDELEKGQVTIKGYNLDCTKDIWSLEDAEFSEATCNIEYMVVTDTLMAVERGNRTYYSQNRDAVSIISSENCMELVSYDMPETWLKFPMQKGDSVSGYFNGTGKYCDRLFIRRFGTDTAKVREDVYRWYADGYRYPILESKTVSYLGKTLSEEMYYCPPEMQELLAFDEENKKTRAWLEKENGNGNGGSGKGNNSPEGFKYHISQDEGSGTVTVSYLSDADIRVDALLASSQGYVYRRASQSDGSEITLSYRGLPRGQYIIHITAGKERFAEKFQVR